jgi:3-hydroxyisobutyrate dehydrogenase-like beta-hydroxyacid dehydrogenase
MTKDIGYAINEGAKFGLPLQTAVPALQVFKDAVGQGLGDQDFSAVVKGMKADRKN